MSTSRDTPPMTLHAKLRWQQRCAELDLDSEWYRSRRLGKKTRAKVKARCAAHRHLMAGRGFHGYWYVISPKRVVFVVGGIPGQIVTVWRLGVEDADA